MVTNESPKDMINSGKNIIKHKRNIALGEIILLKILYIFFIYNI